MFQIAMVSSRIRCVLINVVETEGGYTAKANIVDSDTGAVHGLYLPVIVNLLLLEIGSVVGSYWGWAKFDPVANGLFQLVLIHGH